MAGVPILGAALADLREAMSRAGIDPDRVTLTEIGTEEDAERRAFPGSPTIRVDGVDIEPPAAAQPPALTCRVYRRRDGRVSPLPDPDSLRHALTATAPR